MRGPKGREHDVNVGIFLDNQERLNSCGGHEFVAAHSVLMFRCSHCQGEVNAYARSWYEQGKAHAKNA